ncbi:bifunctional diguanylate cyclase/phosphodiesterase [Vibrio methylphosphonaticus]|uniref:bifunctional diguanylate cyclase/phosphodiesterase n=1 Tax=Vibrio methylphosphonaticus TaxID=2946866 RepID=UPI002029E6E0|nr:EAL domain-containing protein [Vibrio methylphosphonaticus]MCL9777322.1 EAL domain-containing protein [Vibrio methylphosphonaticus]
MAFTHMSLKHAFILPFIVAFLGSVSAILWLQSERYDDIANEVSHKQLSSLTNNVVSSLDIYLDRPMNAVRTIAHAIEYHGLYNPNDTTALESYLLSTFQLLYQNAPQVDLIGFGGEQGEFVGIRASKQHHEGERFTLMTKDAETQHKLNVYAGPSRKQATQDIISPYDPRTRPWYVPIKQTLAVQWSQVYTNADEHQDITISALSPVYYDHEGLREFVGVAAVDIQINTFNHFLESIKRTHKANVFVIDTNRDLIAHSQNQTILDNEGHRISADKSRHPALQYLSNTPLKTDVDTPTLLSFEHDNSTQFVMVSHYQTETNLSWYVIVTISASDLMGNIPLLSKKTLVVGLLLGALGLIIGIFTLNQLTIPITETARASQQIANGRWDYPLPEYTRIREVDQLIKNFSSMRTHLERSFRALREQVTRDPLTKLYSRSGFIEVCDKLLNERSGAMLLININQFRDINDSLGHREADVLLTVVAERLKTWVVVENGVLARTVGNEFAIYLPYLNERELLDYLYRIRQIFTAPFILSGESLSLHISVGATLTDCNHNTDLNLRNASIALSQAKEGTNQFCVYTPDMAESSKKKTRLLTTLYHAVEHQTFNVYFQPIIDLKTKQTIGAEALLRLKDEYGNPISPLDFIPLAESSGLITAIGQQMVTQSIQAISRAIDTQQLATDFQLHLNVSVCELRSNHYVDFLQAALAQSTLPARQVVVELTESRIADNDPIIIENMRRLKALDISIAIDDFGTGYSSLAYLHKLPFDSLKIDKAFIDQLTKENAQESVVSAITKLSRSFGFSIVAEGVETQLQADLAKQLGCHYAQGYLFSTPKPIEEWPLLKASA